MKLTSKLIKQLIKEQAEENKKGPLDNWNSAASFLRDMAWEKPANRRNLAGKLIGLNGEAARAVILIYSKFAGLRDYINEGELLVNCGVGYFLRTAGVASLRGKKLNLQGANMQGAWLKAATLIRANLTDADLTGADLAGADLAGAILTAADLRNANLTVANLTAADLRNANLTRADLTYANLTGANLTNAILNDTSLRGADLADANLTGAMGLEK